MSDLILPGHSIPYKLSDVEQTAFMQQYGTIEPVYSFLMTHEPAYGVVLDTSLNGEYGQFLVSYDFNNNLHVVDVTDMPIAQQVQQAPYESPDASITQNIVNNVQNLISQLTSGFTSGGIGIVIGAAVVIFFMYKRGKL